MRRILPIWRWVAWSVLLLPAAGCTFAQYARQADRAAYVTIASGQQAALGSARPFDVTYRPFAQQAAQGGGSIQVAGKEIPTGPGKPTILTLDDCLDIAFHNSRSLQSQKEDLYSTALALANERRTWNWSLVTGSLTGETDTSRTMKGGSTHSADGEADLTLTQKFIHGGALTLASTVDIASDLLGWKSTTVGSLLEANFTQPLLKGAWRGFAYEDQYRLERDFLFSVFEYERYTQTFAADIVRDHYNVLSERDRLENELANIERLKDAHLLARAKADAGEVSSVQADQAEQSLLSAQVRYEQDKESYKNTLDEFKLTLGLPIQANVELDYPSALEALGKAELKPIPLEESQAIVVALSTRPDLLKQRAAFRDAGRDVEIAADEFLPQLDLTLGISAPGTTPRKFYASRFDRHTRTANLTFNYSLDQTDNRDGYRNAMLDLEKSKRDLDLLVDRIRLQVRQSYRKLVQSQESYKIQVRNVEVATRRSKLAAFEQARGLATTRDVLEAEEDLRDAQNGRTRALISYTTTRVTFLATLGLLRVDEKGKLYEREEPFKFERIGKRYRYVAAEAE